MSDFGLIIIAVLLACIVFLLIGMDTRLERIEHLMQQETHHG
jgi:hypothetical protein